jgi:hypothetical protein
VNAPKDIAKRTIECIRDVMEKKWPQIVDASDDPKTVKHFYPNGWYCPVDIHVGTNWKQCKSKDPADVEPRLALERSLGL